MTSFIKKSEIKNNWLLIDAKNAVVGRLAAYISKVLRGKNKTQFTPHTTIHDHFLSMKYIFDFLKSELKLKLNIH